MTPSTSQLWRHPRCSRRTMIQAGTIGLLGLGMNHVSALRASASQSSTNGKSVIYIFLSGGLAQHDSFDMKPGAPDSIRGEFNPISTTTPGVQICEHLPLLAERSQLWSLIRSMSHPYNKHSEGHMAMLSGRTKLPTGFDLFASQSTDWPSIAAIAGAVTKPRNNLPPAVVLPERLIHNSGHGIPGATAGLMGAQHDPWFIEASKFEPRAYGAYPEYEFDHQEREYKPKRSEFQSPGLSLPEGFGNARLAERMRLLGSIDVQRRGLEQAAVTRSFDGFQQAAVSLLTQPGVRKAFDLTTADPKVLDRYGDNAFGWSLLMARRLVEAGVNLVQVNLGNNETWDTHGNAFPHLKDKLFPPTDRAVSALLDDLHDSGRLDQTLIVMASEFGRTPKISHLPQFYKLSGRDHWGAVQTVLCAGGGTRGGTVVGSSDKIGAYPQTDPQTPENLAATIYHTLGIPPTAAWHDATDRPHYVYYGTVIERLFT